jgi:hypothetical protein
VTAVSHALALAMAMATAMTSAKTVDPERYIRPFVGLIGNKVVFTQRHYFKTIINLQFIVPFPDKYINHLELLDGRQMHVMSCNGNQQEWVRVSNRHWHSWASQSAVTI